MINSAGINAGGINARAVVPLVVVRRLHTTGLAMPPENVALRWQTSVWAMPVSRLHTTAYPNFITRTHTSAYELLTPVLRWHTSTYDLLAFDVVEATFTQALGFSVEQAWALDCGLMTEVEQAWLMPLPLLTTVEQAWVLPNPLEAVDTIEQAWTYVLPLMDESPLVVSSSISLVKDGARIALADSSTLSIEEGDYAWKGQLVLANAGDATKFTYDDALTLNFYGTDYPMLVDTKAVSRANTAAATVSIGVVGPPARFGAPRAIPITVNYTVPTSAKAIVEGLLGAVDWLIDDWIIPANRLGAEGATPISTAQRVVNAAGAVLEAKADGGLLVRYRYPVALSQYPLVSPDHIIYEADSVFSREQPYRYFEKVNRLRMSDIESASYGDKVEYIAGDAGQLAGQLHVYPSPWRDVHVRHTGPNAVALSPLGEVVLEKTEQIEIIGGVGTVGYPISALSSVVWEDVNLGSLIFATGATTLESTSTTATESLVTVVYTTRALVWACRSPIDDVVQFLVVDGAA